MLNFYTSAISENDPDYTWVTGCSLKSLSEMFEIMKLEWYSAVYPEDQPAIDPGKIDYEKMYSFPGYQVALLECWINWTMKSTCNTIQFFRDHPERVKDTTVVADGFGAASIMWASAFPNVKVVAHIMGDSQASICAKALKHFNLPNLTLESGYSPATIHPVVLAYECFEHFYQPQAYATGIVRRCESLVYTAPWAVEAHGHFRAYLMDNDEQATPNHLVSRKFGRWLRDNGFKSSGTMYGFTFFNGYPRMEFKAQPELPGTEAA